MEHPHSRTPVRHAAVVLAALLASAPAHADGQFLALTPDRLVEGAGALSPEGCEAEAGVARGVLAPAGDATWCRSGAWGARDGGGVHAPGILTSDTLEPAAHFVTAPLEEALPLKGQALLVVYYAVANDRSITAEGKPVQDARIDYELSVVSGDRLQTVGAPLARGRIRAEDSPTPTVQRAEVEFSVTTSTVPAGARLRLTLSNTHYTSPGLRPEPGRLIYGGAPLASTGYPGARESYEDAGLTLGWQGPPPVPPPPPPSTPPGGSGSGGGTGGGTGGEPAAPASGGSGGATNPLLLVALAVAALARRARASTTAVLAGAAAVLGVLAWLALPADPMRPSHEYGERYDDKGHFVDSRWAERAASASPRDPTGRALSGARSQVHGGAEGKGRNKTPGHEARLFRTGHPTTEPTLGVTSNGWLFYVGADYSLKANQSVVLRSKDGAATWEVVTAPRFTADRYLWVDPLTDRVFWLDYEGCGALSYSDNLGDTWTDAPPVGCGFHTDHQTIHAGPPVHSTPVGYPNIVYYCSMGGGAALQGSTITVCSKSLDGGYTFLPTLSAPFPATVAEEAQWGLTTACNGASGHIFVSADGTLYVPRGVCGQPWLAFSKDEGATWTRVKVADTGMGYTRHGIWDHEAAVRTDGNGNVFYAWVARDRIPYLAVSRDGGLTWGNPIRIAPPEVNEAVLPNMEIDAAGRLAFIYMATVNSPGAPFPNDGPCEPADCLPRSTIFLGDVLKAGGYEDTTWTGMLTLTSDPLAVAPTFESTPVSAPDAPLIRGECGPIGCGVQGEFIDVVFGPHGQVWASVGCGTDLCGTTGEGLVATLVEASEDPLPDSTPPEYVADGTLALAFTPDPARATGIESPEGCEAELDRAVGALSPSLPAGPCHSGAYGWVQFTAALPAEFTTAPLNAPLVIGGEVKLVIHLADTQGTAQNNSWVQVVLEVLDPNGKSIVTPFNDKALHSLNAGRNEGSFSIPPVTVPVGHRLRLSSHFLPLGNSVAARLLFGGQAYGDAGITLTTGHFVDPNQGCKPGKKCKPPKGPGKQSADAEPAAGPMAPALLVLLAAGALWRRRHHAQPRALAKSFM